MFRIVGLYGQEDKKRTKKRESRRKGDFYLICPRTIAPKSGKKGRKRCALGIRWDELEGQNDVAGEAKVEENLAEVKVEEKAKPDEVPESSEPSKSAEPAEPSEPSKPAEPKVEEKVAEKVEEKVDMQVPPMVPCC